MFFNNLFNNYSPFNNYSNYPYRRSEPVYQNPSDTRSIITQKLFNDDNNYYCFDCRRRMNCLNYFDIKNAIFLCYNCAIQHSRYPKEITEVLSGDIRSLEDKYLYALYFGGNKNLVDFMRRYYPLLEKMEKRNMYSTVAMDYYRQLIISKVYNQREPYMPRKLEGYNSIFRNRNNPANENNYGGMNDEKVRNNLYSSSNIGNNLFGRNSINNNNINKNKNTFFKSEPAVINNRNENNDNEDIEIQDDNHSKKSKKSDNSISEDSEGISDKENQSQNKETIFKNKSEYNKEKNINNNNNKIEENNLNNLTINQLGELSMYPDALEIDRMEC